MAAHRITVPGSRPSATSEDSMMGKTILYLAIATLFSPHAIAGANCAHSNSWQCQHHNFNSGTSTTTPTNVLPQIPSSTGVLPLGSVLPDHHNVALLPADPGKPKPVIKPVQQQPIPTPNPIPAQQQVPMLIPPQPNLQTPALRPIGKPKHILPQQQTP